MFFPLICFADIYNGNFSLYNPATKLPAGWTAQSTEIYKKSFATYIKYISCVGVGKARTCKYNYAVKLQREETWPQYQYLRLNNIRIQPVTPGSIYKYMDETNCNTSMPVVINYFSNSKSFIRSVTFQNLTVPNLKWTENKFWHKIPTDAYYISIFRTISPSTPLLGNCLVDKVHNTKVQK